MTIQIKVKDLFGKNVSGIKLETYEHACISFLNQWGITNGINIELHLDFLYKDFNNSNSVLYKEEQLKQATGSTFFISQNRFKVFLNRKHIIKLVNESRDSKLNKDDLIMYFIITSLAHELVHVKQHFYKELKYVHNKVFFNNLDITNVDCEANPCEEEAFYYAELMRNSYYKEKVIMYDFFINDYSFKGE